MTTISVSVRISFQALTIERDCSIHTVVRVLSIFNFHSVTQSSNLKRTTAEKNWPINYHEIFLYEPHTLSRVLHRLDHALYGKDEPLDLRVE